MHFFVKLHKKTQLCTTVIFCFIESIKKMFLYVQLLPKILSATDSTEHSTSEAIGTKEKAEMKASLTDILSVVDLP